MGNAKLTYLSSVKKSLDKVKIIGRDFNKVSLLYSQILDRAKQYCSAQISEGEEDYKTYKGIIDRKIKKVNTCSDICEVKKETLYSLGIDSYTYNDWYLPNIFEFGAMLLAYGNTRPEFQDSFWTSNAEVNPGYLTAYKYSGVDGFPTQVSKLEQHKIVPFRKQVSEPLYSIGDSALGGVIYGYSIAGSIFTYYVVASEILNAVDYGLIGSPVITNYNGYTGDANTTLLVNALNLNGQINKAAQVAQNYRI